MARNRWDTEEPFEIPLTPLIDIIFILIVFFLVATTFYTEERDLDIQLPEGTEGNLIPQETTRFVINVRQAGVIVVNNKILTMQELEGQLKEIGSGGKRPVEVRGDAGTRHGKIMAVMNLCKKSGVGEYSLTQRIVKEVP